MYTFIKIFIRKYIWKLEFIIKAKLILIGWLYKCRFLSDKYLNYVQKIRDVFLLQKEW